MFQLFKGKRNEKRSLKLPPGLSKKDQRRVQEVIDRAKKNDGIPRTAQQSIPFDRMFPDGICRVGSFYTKTIQFQDINYQLAQQEDKTAIFEEWCGFLNFFDSSIHFELSFMNMTTDAESFEAGIRIPYRKDDFNSVRDEYSEMLKAQLAQGNNGLTKTKFLTFGIEADSMKQAKPRLEHVQNDLLNNFKQLGVRAEVLNGYQRLKLMHDMFHMGDPEDKFRFDWKWLVESGLSVKDFIAPTAFAFPGSRTFQMGSRPFRKGLHRSHGLCLPRQPYLPDGKPVRCHELSSDHRIRPFGPAPEGFPGHGFLADHHDAHPVCGPDGGDQDHQAYDHGA